MPLSQYPTKEYACFPCMAANISIPLQHILTKTQNNEKSIIFIVGNIANGGLCVMFQGRRSKLYIKSK